MSDGEQGWGDDFEEDAQSEQRDSLVMPRPSSTNEDRPK